MAKEMRDVPNPDVDAETTDTPPVDSAFVSTNTKLDEYVKIMVSLRGNARPILCW